MASRRETSVMLRPGLQNPGREAISRIARSEPLRFRSGVPQLRIPREAGKHTVETFGFPGGVMRAMARPCPMSLRRLDGSRVDALTCDYKEKTGIVMDMAPFWVFS